MGEHMKTIFDTLALPEFRKKPGLYIGKRDLQTLGTWTIGYIAACTEANEQRRLNTPNGLPIALLRDYIALQESDRSVGGIADILAKASNSQNETAWTKFFSYLDDFMRLEIVSVQRLQVTDEMKQFAVSQNRYFEMKDGKAVPHCFYMNTIVKKSLSNGLCWTIKATDYDESIFREIYDYSIMPDKEADRVIQELFGAAKWEEIR